jgi:hypothetical protein
VAHTNGTIPAGRIRRSVELPTFAQPDSHCTAILQLRDSGELGLYREASGYPVSVQIAEDCTSWETWYSAPAAQVAKLGGDPDTAFEAVRDQILESGKTGSDTVTPFLAILRNHRATYEFAERINYYD